MDLGYAPYLFFCLGALLFIFFILILLFFNYVFYFVLILKYVCIVGCRGASQLGGSLLGIPPGYKANKLKESLSYPLGILYDAHSYAVDNGVIATVTCQKTERTLKLYILESYFILVHLVQKCVPTNLPCQENYFFFVRLILSLAGV